MTRYIARPTTTSLRPAARAALATEPMRATLEAKVVTATRRGALRISSSRVTATSASDGEMPSRTALVESQISAVMPASPSALSRASSVGPLVSGVSSSFQSPVWSTVPSSVLITTPDGSGIECDMVTSSISNGPMVRRPPMGMTSSGKPCSMPTSASFDLSIEAVKGVA